MCFTWWKWYHWILLVYTNPMVYNMSWKNKVEKINSNIFDDHVQMRMPSLSIFTQSDSTHFSENFDVWYMSVWLWHDKKSMYEWWKRGIWDIIYEHYITCFGNSGKHVLVAMVSPMSEVDGSSLANSILLVLLI
jgi:hypothetical protein